MTAIATGTVALTVTTSATAATGSDAALARSALLARSDLGRGWTSSQPAPSKVPPLTCSAFAPHLSGVAETGAAASPTFGHSSSGPFVSSVAYVYRTTSQTTEVWRRVVTPKLGRCVSASLVAGSGQGVKFTVNSKQQLPPIAAGDRGYRVIGTASSAYQQITVYLDVLVIERGRMLAAISISNFEAPAARSLEQRLARKVAGRLGG